MRRIIVCTLVLMLFASLAFTQESAVKGTISGAVMDASGAVVPDAKVTYSGAYGSKTTMTGKDGQFNFPYLAPGMYSIKVERTGFNAAEVKSVEVSTGKTSQVQIKLQPGVVTETVEVSADAVSVDTQSTANSTNLNDVFYAKVPVGRNIAGLLYTAPGVANGGGTGTANPSISGSSGLENTYYADGVNITDSAFGGLGTFTRAQGSIGTGINLSFIKEVQVKTSGFEPQYGQSEGGIVQIVTKSGGRDFHGAIAGYAAPQSTKATPLFRDDFRQNDIGKFPGNSDYDASAELGGYVPGFRNHLFFFTSVNPSVQKAFRTPPAIAPISSLGTITQRTNTFNYDAKVTWQINDKHSVEGTIFADPSHTNIGAYSQTSLNLANTTGFSKLEYGTRNIAARYNGTLSNTWLLSGAFTYNINNATETPSADVFQIVDRTTSITQTLQGFGFLENHEAHSANFNIDTSKVMHSAIGEHTLSLGYRYERPNYVDVKARSGGRFVVPDTNLQGGAYLPTANNPAGHLSDAQFNLLKSPLADTTLPFNAVTNPFVCTLCPLLNVNGTPTPVFLSMVRGEWGAGGRIPTFGKYHAAYINDNWAVNKHVNLTLGLRWEQQRMAGNVASQQYTFTGNWAPRLGVSIDPKGNRKTKIYANFGRYNYEMPLDAAIRQLSQELDLLNVAFAPSITNGVVSVVPDKAHLLNQATGGIPVNGKVSIAGLGEAIASGTKMQYTDEYVVGVEHETHGFVLSARYVDRRLQRVIEDVGSISPEGNLVLAQNSFISNPSPTLDLFTNEIQQNVTAGQLLQTFDPRITSPGATPAQLLALRTFAGNVPGCLLANTAGTTSTTDPVTGVVSTFSAPTADGNGNVFSPNSICFVSPGPGLVGGDVGADGKPDGFVKPVRIYRAMEFEVNKSFSNNYLLRVNYRVAHLYGNYEGTFRNDNAQTDPGISSLFDFTAGKFNLLGDQFKQGDLNTDRRHVVNAFFSYTVPKSMFKALTLGTSIRVQAGTPISEFADHPAYLNAGEVPIGGRGLLGRTPVQANIDFKADYPFKIGERQTFHLGADLFNIFDARRVNTVDQNRDLTQQPANSNLDFLQPLTFQQPFAARFSLRWEF